MQRFVILTAGRTGSRHLLALLRSHPDIACCGEVLGATVVPSKPPNYMALVRDRLESAFGVVRKPATHIGFKMLYQQMFGEIEAFGRYFAAENFKIIHLIRHNVLNTLLSGKLANASGQYRGAYPEGLQVKITPQQLLQAIENREKSLADIYPHLSNYLDVSYEQLRDEESDAMERVFDFLGVPEAPISSYMNVQRKEHQSHYIANWDELKRYFVGTKYATFFEKG